LAALLVACAVLLAVGLAAGAGLPGPAIPDGLGVNIHFTGEPARDLDMIQAAGWRFVRMDLIWELVEKKEGKGVYDFAAYDQLTDALARRGIRALYILDYSNAHYEADSSVRTEEGRQAFARFAAAAAQRYRGRGMIWELWNEPNIDMFWKPEPNARDYMALAEVVFPAIRKADPSALCVAPAAAGFDFGFLEECFRQGLLDLVDAITVHPYRQGPPEAVAADYEKLRALMKRYHADRPILSGEWGYSSGWQSFDDRLQGEYLARQFLTNLSLGITLSIWYDWHDDGPDPNEPEHHFGTVTLDYRAKPAYREMERLVRALSGKRFARRLPSRPEDHLLLFSGGDQSVLAAWTTDGAHEVQLTPDWRIALSGSPKYVSVPAPRMAALAGGQAERGRR